MKTAVFTILFALAILALDCGLMVGQHRDLAARSWMYSDSSAAQLAGLIKTQIPLSSRYQTMGPDSPPNFQSQLNGLIMQKIAAPAEGGATTANPASVSLPPRFLPGVAVYKDKRFMGLVVGKTVHATCRDALDATQSAIAKHFEAVDGSSAIGLCIPVPTYAVADLVPPPDSAPKFPPRTDPAKPADDNQV